MHTVVQLHLAHIVTTEVVYKALQLHRQDLGKTREFQALNSIYLGVVRLACKVLVVSIQDLRSQVVLEAPLQ